MIEFSTQEFWGERGIKSWLSRDSLLVKLGMRAVVQDYEDVQMPLFHLPPLKRPHDKRHADKITDATA
jgi:hypothetical protein